MAIKLVVTSAFFDFVPGNEITDADQVKQFLETHPSYVVKVEVAEQPAPQGKSDT